MVATIQVAEINEFIRTLSILPNSIKTLTRVFQTAAALTVMVRAKEAAQGLGSTAALASRDVRVGGIGVVKYGGKAYDFGAEYGSYAYKQFQTWRGNSEDAGYFFWPTVREFRDKEMLNLWMEDVGSAFQQAFPD